MKNYSTSTINSGGSYWQTINENHVIKDFTRNALAVDATQENITIELPKSSDLFIKANGTVIIKKTDNSTNTVKIICNESEGDNKSILLENKSDTVITLEVENDYVVLSFSEQVSLQGKYNASVVAINLQNQLNKKINKISSAVENNLVSFSTDGDIKDDGYYIKHDGSNKGLINSAVFDEYASKIFTNNIKIDNVACTTTESIPLNGVDIEIDGYIVKENDKVLVKNQTTVQTSDDKGNGVYIVQSDDWVKAYWNGSQYTAITDTQVIGSDLNLNYKKIVVSNGDNKNITYTVIMSHEKLPIISCGITAIRAEQEIIISHYSAYVDVIRGNDQYNKGTRSSPFATVSKALSSTHLPRVIELAGVYYNEVITLEETHSNLTLQTDDYSQDGGKLEIVQPISTTGAFTRGKFVGLRFTTNNMACVNFGSSDQGRHLFQDCIFGSISDDGIFSFSANYGSSNKHNIFSMFSFYQNNNLSNNVIDESNADFMNWITIVNPDADGTPLKLPDLNDGKSATVYLENITRRGFAISYIGTGWNVLFVSGTSGFLVLPSRENIKGIFYDFTNTITVNAIFNNQTELNQISNMPSGFYAINFTGSSVGVEQGDIVSKIDNGTIYLAEQVNYTADISVINSDFTSSTYIKDHNIWFKARQETSESMVVADLLDTTTELLPSTIYISKITKAKTIAIANSSENYVEIVIRDDNKHFYSNNLTINAPTGQTINGSSSYVIKTMGVVLTIIKKGTNWVIVSEIKPKLSCDANKTSAFNAIPNKMYGLDSTNASFTITLPHIVAGKVGDGEPIVFHDIGGNLATHPVTINGNSLFINGQENYVCNQNYGAYILYANTKSNNWLLISTTLHNDNDNYIFVSDDINVITDKSYYNIATKAVTYTLNISPKNGDSFSIKNLSDTHNITILGNGKTINGSSDPFVIKEQSAYYIFIFYNDNWYIVNDKGLTNNSPQSNDFTVKLNNRYPLNYTVAKTLSLPIIDLLYNNAEVEFYDISGTAKDNNITLVASAGYTINKQSSIVIKNNYQVINLKFDQANNNFIAQLNSDGSSYSLPTIVITEEMTLSSNNSYLVNLPNPLLSKNNLKNNSPLPAKTLALPVSPANNEIITIKDINNNFSRYGVSINPNGNNLNGQLDAFVLADDGVFLEIQYNSSTNDWIILILDIPFLKNTTTLAESDYLYTNRIYELPNLTSNISYNLPPQGYVKDGSSIIINDNTLSLSNYAVTIISVAQTINNEAKNYIWDKAGSTLHLIYSEKSNGWVVFTNTVSGGGNSLISTTKQVDDFVAINNRIMPIGTINKAITANLPGEIALKDGSPIVFWDADSSFDTNPFTITGGVKTINGKTQLVLDQKNQAVSLYYDGTNSNWVAIFINDGLSKYNIIVEATNTLLHNSNNLYNRTQDSISTLPNTAIENSTIIIADIGNNFTTYPLTINAPSGISINDNTEFVCNNNSMYLQLVQKGTNWEIVHKQLSLPYSNSTIITTATTLQAGTINSVDTTEQAISVTLPPSSDLYDGQNVFIEDYKNNFLINPCVINANTGQVVNNVNQLNIYSNAILTFKKNDSRWLLLTQNHNLDKSTYSFLDNSYTAPNSRGVAFIKNGMVYASGLGGYYKSPFSANKFSQNNATFNSFPINKPIKKIVYNNDYIVMLSESGEVYVWGVLRNGTFVEQYHFSTILQLIFNPIVKIKDIIIPQGTEGHTPFNVYMISEDDVLYSVGDKAWGQCGDGSTNLFSLIPNQVLINEKIINVAVAGISGISVCATTVSGAVYTWGYGGSGCLGTGNTASVSEPFLIPGLPQITKAFGNGTIAHNIATQYFMLLANDGSVYGCGYNGWGELGVGDRINKLVFTKSQLSATSSLENIIDIYCMRSYASCYTAVINVDGRLFFAGRSHESCFGDGLPDGEHIYFEGTDELNNAPFQGYMQNNGIVKPCVKQWGSSSFGQLGTIILDNRGKAWVAGYNTDGRFGLIDSSLIDVPIRSWQQVQTQNNIPIKHIVTNGFYNATEQGLLVQLINDDIYCCGNNSYGSNPYEYVPKAEDNPVLTKIKGLD